MLQAVLQNIISNRFNASQSTQAPIVELTSLRRPLQHSIFVGHYLSTSKIKAKKMPS